MGAKQSNTKTHQQPSLESLRIAASTLTTAIERKDRLHASPTAAIDPRGDPFWEDDVQQIPPPPSSPNLQLPNQRLSPTSFSSFSTNRPVGDEPGPAGFSLLTESGVGKCKTGLQCGSAVESSSSDSLSAASDILDRMREMARRAQQTNSPTTPVGQRISPPAPPVSNSANSSFSPVMKNVAVECANDEEEEYSTEEVDDGEVVDGGEDEEDATPTSQGRQQPPQIYGDGMQPQLQPPRPAPRLPEVLKHHTTPPAPPQQALWTCSHHTCAREPEWDSPCPSPAMGVATLTDGSSMLTVFVRKFGEDQILWRDWSKKIERTMRGLQRQYGCLIKVYDRPAEHRGSKVHKIRIRGLSHKEVLRCKNAFPHYIRDMLITSHEHYDDIVYDVVNRRI